MTVCLICEQASGGDTLCARCAGYVGQIDLNAGRVIDACQAVARVAHADAVGKYGSGPYITDHVEPVATLTASVCGMFTTFLTATDRVQAVSAAWLHDVPEDVPDWPLDRVQATLCRFPGFTRSPLWIRPVVTAVGLLTHEKGTPRRPYLEAIAADPVARPVKLADTLRNLSGIKTAVAAGRMDEPTAARLGLKYSEALEVLLP